MKKVFSFILALAMVLALASCSQKQETPTASTLPAAASSEPAPDVSDSIADTSTAPAEGTPAQVLAAAFRDYVNSGAVYACESVAGELVQNEAIASLDCVVSEVQAGYLNGFTDEIDDFSEGVMFAPMIGSIPFVGYVFQVEEDEDVTEFMNELKQYADLRWNVCTEADEMVCENVGNTVLFVMSPASFDAE